MNSRGPWTLVPDLEVVLVIREWIRRLLLKTRRFLPRTWRFIAWNPKVLIWISEVTTLNPEVAWWSLGLNPEVVPRGWTLGLFVIIQRLFVLNPKVIFFEIVLRHTWVSYHRFRLRIRLLPLRSRSLPRSCNAVLYFLQKAALRLLLFGVSQPGGATQSPDLDTFHVWSSRD